MARRQTYSAYLASPHWQAKRREALEHYGARCSKCQATDRILQVHHKTYRRLGAELLEDLEVLCKVCHRKVHGAEQQRRRGRGNLWREEFKRNLAAGMSKPEAAKAAKRALPPLTTSAP